MNLIKTLFCLFLFVFSLISCSNNSEVSVVNPFEKADNYKLEVLRKKGQTTNLDELEAFDEGLYTNTSVSLNIKEINDNNIVGSWVYNETSNIYNGEKQPTDEANDLFNGIQLDFSYDKLDQATTLNNYDEVFKTTQNAFKKIYQIGEVDSLTEMQQMALQNFISRANTPESLLENFFPELELLFTNMNKTFQTEKEDTSSIESPYGMLSIFTNYRVEEFEGNKELIQEDTISKTQYKKLLTDFIQKQYGEVPQDIPLDQMDFNYGRQIVTIIDDKKPISVEENKYYSYAGRSAMLRSKIVIK